jgi:hypothetical protein
MDARALSHAASLVLAFALLAGCGADVAPAGPAAPTAAPAAAPAAAPVQGRTLADHGTSAKSDLRQAVSIIESYAMDNGGYASAMGATGLPSTVTIAAVRSDGYSVVASTADGASYAIDRLGSEFVRRCAPLQPADCRTGSW